MHILTDLTLCMNVPRLLQIGFNININSHIILIPMPQYINFYCLYLDEFYCFKILVLPKMA